MNYEALNTIVHNLKMFPEQSPSLLGKNDVRIGQFDGISSIAQFPPLHTAAVTGLCYSHLEKKMTFSAATTEDVMLGSQLIDDKKQIPQYSTYFKCLC